MVGPVPPQPGTLLRGVPAHSNTPSDICTVWVLHSPPRGLTTTTPVNGIFSRTACLSRYQKDKSSLDLNEARDDGGLGCSGISWTICGTICTSLQTDNHTNTSSVNFLQAGCSPDAQPDKTCKLNPDDCKRAWMQ